jgi:hypothetical protein
MNRNRIKTSQGPIWLTVPLNYKGNSRSSLNEITIDNSSHWQKKHWQSIQHNYSKAPFFKTLQDLWSVYTKQYTHFDDLCFDVNELLFSMLSLAPPRILKTSDLQNITRTGSDLILQICQSVGAHEYLSGPFGMQYLDTDAFTKNDIDIIYHSYSCPPYPQLYNDFLEDLSVIDLIANVQDPLATIIQGGREHTDTKENNDE